MMKNKELEERIRHVKRNLSFFSKFWKELEKTKEGKQNMYKTVDFLLDKLIELLKQKK